MTSNWNILFVALKMHSKVLTAQKSTSFCSITIVWDGCLKNSLFDFVKILGEVRLNRYNSEDQKLFYACSITIVDCLIMIVVCSFMIVQIFSNNNYFSNIFESLLISSFENWMSKRAFKLHWRRCLVKGISKCIADVAWIMRQLSGHLQTA